MKATLSNQTNKLKLNSAHYSAAAPLPAQKLNKRLNKQPHKKPNEIVGGASPPVQTSDPSTQSPLSTPDKPSTHSSYPPEITRRSSGLNKPLSQPMEQRVGWSDSIQAVLERPPARLTQYLISAGLIFSGIFVAWACIGTLQEVSHAQGELIPQGETFKIQPVMAGKVDSLSVQEGESVERDQVLLSLDSDLLEAEAKRLEQALTAAEQELDQVRSLIEQAEQENLTRSQIAAASTQSTLAALQQSEESVATSETMLLALNDDINAHQERFERIKKLEGQGAISKEYLFSVEQAVRNKQQAIAQNEGQKQQVLAQIRQAEAELNQKQAEEKQIEILAQQSLQELQIEQQQLQADIADLQTQLSQALTNLSQSHVKAPTEGIVSTLTVNNVGEFVQPGQILAEVMPANVPLVLTAIVPHRDAGLLKVGMEANIKMDAFPYQDYGILSGQVISISPDAKTLGEVVDGYQVSISLDEDFVIHEQQAIKLQIGQTANAEIVVRRRRIIEVLLDPIRQITENELSM